jgi:hypothetical protein
VQQKADVGPALSAPRTCLATFVNVDHRARARVDRGGDSGFVESVANADDHREAAPDEKSMKGSFLLALPFPSVLLT